MLTGDRTACDPSEQSMDWVVGGEVTDIQFGPGLVGAREDGQVRVGLDGSIIEACDGCRGGKVFAGFNDGPGPVEYSPEGPLTIARLNLPAGAYVILAKLILSTSDDESFIQRLVTCRLTAGADFDEGRVFLETAHHEKPGYTGGSCEMGLALQVVHRFTEPGTVELSAAYQLGSLVFQDVEFHDLKIIAVEASSISNEFLAPTLAKYPGSRKRSDSSTQPQRAYFPPPARNAASLHRSVALK